MTSSVFRASTQACIVAVACALLLSGCSDALEDFNPVSYNPFRAKEKKLPGERHEILTDAPSTISDDDLTKAPVSIPAPSGGADWSQPGGNAANAPGNVALSGGAGSWSVQVARVERRGRLASPPIVAQGRAIVMETDGTVTAYSLSGGGRAWAAALRPKEENGRGYGGGVAAGDGVIVAATPYSTVVGLDPATGGVAWTAEVGAPARSAPTVAGGLAYVVTADNVVHAISVSDGTEKWNHTGIGEMTGVLGNASPAVGSGKVVVPYTSGEILAFNAQDGSPEWLDALTGANKFTSVSGLNDVARPVIYDGTVYAVSVSGRLIATGIASGNRQWAQTVASSHQPAVAGNTVFIATLNGEVVAIDRSNGKFRWRSKVTGKEGKAVDLAGPLLAGSRLWVGTSDGRVVTLDPQSGNVTGSVSVGNPVFLSPIAAGGRVLVLDNGGKLTSLD